MNRFYYAFIIIGILFGSFTVAARADVPMVYPAGLNGPSNAVSGIYPGTDAASCCWIGASAAFKTAAPRGADTLLLNVYLPKFAAPPNGLTLRVSTGTGAVQTRCCLGAGEHELAFKISASHIAVIRLWASSTFVPKEIGLNQDPRHLSVLLRGVAFEDSATGERFDTGALPWMPPRVALALLGLAGALVFVLTIRAPIYGVAALILSDPFLVAYAIHGTTITLPKVALLAVFAGLLPRFAAIVRMRAWHALAALGAAQLLLIASMAMAYPHAAFHGAAVRETLKAVQYAITLFVAYVAYRLDAKENTARLCLSIVTIVVTLLAFAQLFAPAMESEIVAGHTVTRIAGPLEGPNQFSGFLGVVVPAMVAFSLYRAPLLIERAAIALGTVACLMTFSRAGIGALVLSIVLILAIRYQTTRRSAIAPLFLAGFALVLSLAFGVFTGAVHGRVQHLFGATGDDAFNGGLGSRIDLWHGAYAMWRSHPLFGIGPGNFEYAIGRFDPGVRTHANGMYFQVLAEQGIAGLAALFALVAASVCVFLRRLNTPLALAACAGAVAMAFHQILDCMWLYPKVGVMWWIVLALGAAAVDLGRASENLAEAAIA